MIDVALTRRLNSSYAYLAGAAVESAGAAVESAGAISTGASSTAGSSCGVHATAPKERAAAKAKTAILPNPLDTNDFIFRVLLFRVHYHTVMVCGIAGSC
jgi:hypothetical protein